MVIYILLLSKNYAIFKRKALEIKAYEEGVNRPGSYHRAAEKESSQTVGFLVPYIYFLLPSLSLAI